MTLVIFVASGGGTAYVAASWTGYAGAVAAVAATLAGLLFVAVSINLQRILDFPNLPGRAGQTLITFVTPLILALFVLVPGQGRTALGWEFIIAALVIVGAQLLIDHRAGRSEQETRYTWLLTRVFPAVMGCALVLAAGISLLAGGGGRLYWLVPAVLIFLVSGLGNAWVLLIEIQR